MQGQIKENRWHQPTKENSLWWFQNITNYIQVLSSTTKQLGERIVHELDSGASAEQKRKTVTTGAVLIFCVLALWPVMVALLILIVKTAFRFLENVKAGSKFSSEHHSSKDAIAVPKHYQF